MAGIYANWALCIKLQQTICFREVLQRELFLIHHSDDAQYTDFTHDGCPATIGNTDICKNDFHEYQ